MPSATNRPVDLTRSFHDAFGAPPTHRAHAPGRVNLIGEHIDYNGLSVLPMALTRGTTILFRPRDDATMRMANAVRDLGTRTFGIATRIVPGPPGDWENYLKAAALTVGGEYRLVRGMDAIVGSTIPMAAGLSSSSALVVATALALLAANDQTASPLELAAALAAGERYVGTRGGGMDQAVALTARAGAACRIDFGPLTSTPITVPADWRFLVAHSLAHVEKSGAAQAAYNRRTDESARALALVCRALGLPGAPPYRWLLRHVPEADVLRAATRLDDPLGKRLRHVVTEARRVRDAERALARSDLATFGRLLAESHASLRDDYEVSTTALNQIVDIATGAGAAGARLTGAGMGGCALAACPTATVDAVLGALRERFYEPRGIRDDADMKLFVAEPAEGATVTAIA